MYPEIPTKKEYTIEESATLLGVPRRVVLELVRRNILPARRERVGVNVVQYISHDAIDEYKNPKPRNDLQVKLLAGSGGNLKRRGRYILYVTEEQEKFLDTMFRSGDNNEP